MDYRDHSYVNSYVKKKEKPKKEKLKLSPIEIFFFQHGPPDEEKEFIKTDEEWRELWEEVKTQREDYALAFPWAQAHLNGG